MSLANMLANLKEAGISPAPEISLEEIEEEVHLDDGYEMLLCILGSNTEDDRGIPRSHDIWHFDTECIYGNGDYVEIAQHLKLLAGNALPIEEITDYVGDDEAWIEFLLDGQIYRWNIEVDRDWVDPKIFTRFANLLASRQQSVQFICQGLAQDCQDCLIGCATLEQLQFLNSLPGLHFEHQL